MAKVEFDANPGPMQVSIAVESTSGEILDRDMREIPVPDYTTTGLAISTPAIVRARTALEWRRMSAAANPPPTATREFRRTDRLLIRFEVYAPGAAPAAVQARLLNRGGDAIVDVPVQPVGGANIRQVDLALANLAPGEYLVEIQATLEDQTASELLAFRLTS